MSISVKLSPPIIESKLAAQNIQNGVTIPFLMNRAVGWDQFKRMYVSIRSVQSNTLLATWSCLKESIVFRDGKYWASFNKNIGDTTEAYFIVGQSYKVQLAYAYWDQDTGEETIGHYSSVASFKFTAQPELMIEGLSDTEPNSNIGTYTGTYTTTDPSEKVYTYKFDLYDDANVLIATSGECLHNSSKDTSTTTSSDEWSMQYSLNNKQNYNIVYTVTTTNGLQCSSIPYRIYTGDTFNSGVFNYSNFIAEINSDEAYVELSLEPNGVNQEEKYISGQFILSRASNEDNYSTWYEVTRFVLAAHNVLTPLFICRDYCVSQGVTYKYGLQAYNTNNVYSNKKMAVNKFNNSDELFVDFEDMFLSDGERQLKIRFNPKVTSFKNTLLESKMDTLGSKYPFFFRNGNVSYKEFPISGLISVRMDPEGAFAKGIQITSQKRLNTPSKDIVVEDLPNYLTGNNIRKEREFKMEVLNWLINGKPKLFRSPTEGSYIVRLMNTSLSPNDTLGRMLHTFSCTAYEIDDFNFTNLRKYGMMVDEYVEMRDLLFKNINLDTNEDYEGAPQDLSACTATIKTNPFTKLRYKLKSDGAEWRDLTIGNMGIYVFPTEVLTEDPLMAIAPPEDCMSLKNSFWQEGSILQYSTYKTPNLLNFSHINNIEVKDHVKQFIGKINAVNAIEDRDKIRVSLGAVYYLKLSARPIIPVESVEPQPGNWYRFKIGTNYHRPSNEELLRYQVGETVYYYDGLTKEKIGTREDLDFRIKLRNSGQYINMEGSLTDQKALNDALGLGKSEDPLRNVSGKLILTNLSDIDSLELGNGTYADMAYQTVTRIYSVELIEGEIKDKKERWLNSNSDYDYEEYYTALTNYLDTVEEDSMLDAV